MDPKPEAVPSAEAIARAREDAAEFITKNQTLVQSLAGVRGVTIKVGQGFATSMEDLTVTVDPGFFVEQGYRPEWGLYGLLHEMRAHLNEMVTQPKLSREKSKFYQRGIEYATFLNVFDDIAGNRHIHGILPTMKAVAKEVYAEKMTPNADLSEDPRHLQFVFSLLRESMIGDGDTVVSDEVAEAIEGLREYGKSKEDAIEYVCDPAIPSKKRWKVLQKVILPVYEELLKKDIKEKKDQPQDQTPQQSSDDSQSGEGDPQQGGEGKSQSQSQPGESGDQSGNQTDGGPSSESGQSGSEEGDSPSSEGSQAGSEPSDGQSGEQSGQSSSPGQSGQPSSSGQGSASRGHQHGHNTGKSTAGDMFDEEYDKYWDTHPEIFDEEQEQAAKDLINEAIKNGEAEPDRSGSDGSAENQAKDQAAGGKPTGKSDPEGPGGLVSDESIRYLEEITGTSYEVIQDYRNKLYELWDTIEELERFYEAIIDERVTVSTKQRRYQDEGYINSDQLADAYIAAKTGEEGSFYQETSTQIERVPDSGGFDFYLLIDRSGSMAGESAQLAAEAAMVITEGLASCHEKVLEAQKDLGVEIGLDVATSVMTFGQGVSVLKAAGETLSEEERMSIYEQTQQANENATADYLALEQVLVEIQEIPEDADRQDRKKIVIVISDGGSSNSGRARQAIDALHDEGVVVIGVGIGSDQSKQLYQPNGMKINSAQDLPETLLEIVKEQISSGVLKKPVSV